MGRQQGIMKCLVLCAMVALSLAEGEPEALPFRFVGAVSNTNVNVPGQFSYSVSSIHPTEERESPVNFALPAGFNKFRPFLGLRNRFYRPWGHSLYSLGGYNPYLSPYHFGYNGLPLNYPYRQLAFVPVPAPASQE